MKANNWEYNEKFQYAVSITFFNCEILHNYTFIFLGLYGVPSEGLEQAQFLDLDYLFRLF